MNTRRPVRAMCTFSSRGRRPAQEDHQVVNRERGIFVVADGFGGHVPGAEASRTACEAVRDFLEKEAGDLDATLPFVLRSYFSLAGNVLFNALMYANKQVLKMCQDRNINEKGGASVAAGFIDGDLLAVANAGACSVWLIRGGRARELVIPKTYARLQDPANVDPPPGFAVPLMALGTSEDIEPEIAEYRLKPGDWLLFQTDGVRGPARAKLERLQEAGVGYDEAAHRIKAALEEQDFDDNASISLAIF